MPVKIPVATEVKLRSASLPTYGGRYAVVPHGFIIDEVKKELANAGFSIKNEFYKTTKEGEVAQGVYHLNYGNDTDMGLMFAWSNSYNKTMRFKCAIGAHVFVCMNGVVKGDMGSYSRKHTGSALSDVTNMIQEQIKEADNFYNTLIQDKELLKNIMLTARMKGTILGELFAKEEILTLSQVGVVKREMDKPSHNYNCNADSAWAMYNHITLALKEAHPSSYLADHQRVHDYFIKEFGQPQVVPVSQLTLNLDEVIQKGSDFDIDKINQSIQEDFEETNDVGVNFM